MTGREIGCAGVDADALPGERCLYRRDPHGRPCLDLGRAPARVVPAVRVPLKVQPVGEPLFGVRLDGADVVRGLGLDVLAGPREVVRAGDQAGLDDARDVFVERAVARVFALGRFGESEDQAVLPECGSVLSALVRGHVDAAACGHEASRHEESPGQLARGVRLRWVTWWA